MRRLLPVLLFMLVSVPASRAQVVTSSAGHKIMLFGGEGHKTYLGCLSCSKYEEDSILNQYGSYGSRYAEDSIFNPYGDFGSRYSSTSVCNPYAIDPPVIVDEDGNFYGRLTINNYALERIQNETLNAWVEGVCLDR